MNKTIIIAEAGVNHNGSIELAKRLAATARECGADIVKFQTYKLDSLVSKYAQMAEYQANNIGRRETQKEMLRKLSLTYGEFIELKEYCDAIGIQFLSTPFDIESVEFLNSIGCEFWKIPSGEITDYPYLLKIATTKKPIILSTGMSTIEEIHDAVDVLKKNGAEEISILHCTTQYPTPPEDVNLKAMSLLKREFGCRIGYSDHTQGIEVAISAVALGAEIIEKHFTIDRNMEGPDHKASLEPDEFRSMVQGIRKVELALGTGDKKPTESETPNIAVARKSIVAMRDIKKGEKLTEYNLTTKRPGDGISPMKWNQVVGRDAKRDFKEDELIEV